MQQYWVPASKALTVLAKEFGGEYPAILAICRRAHSGLVRSQAKLLIVGKQRHENATVPDGFWWAEGHEALDQDWTTGDFATWIEQKTHLQAFGVEFDFVGLRDLLKPEIAASAARQLSVAYDGAWLSAKDARKFMYERYGSSPTEAGADLIEHCKLGFVAARAVSMQYSENGQLTAESPGEREWSVPEWFWHNFTKADSSAQNWDSAVFSGKGRTPTGVAYLRLGGVYFERSSLEALFLPDEQPKPNQSNPGGRPRKEWWDDLWCAVWGQVYRGDLKPKNQAEIAQAMMTWIEVQGGSASESTIKPLARKMFVEMQL